MIIAKISPENTSVSGTQIYGIMVITLFDAATGQLTNGNNIIISYNQNINGVITNGQVRIPGQATTIYSGLLSDQDPLYPYFTTFQIDNVGTVPNPAPPVNYCDLVINYINIDNPESAPGAANGQITINATSSYGPVMYSLDNVTFQS